MQFCFSVLFLYEARRQFVILCKFLIITIRFCKHRFLLPHFVRTKEKYFYTPVRRAWRSFKFAPFLGFFSMSKVGPALMGDTAGFPLLFSALLHII